MYRILGEEIDKTKQGSRACCCSPDVSAAKSDGKAT